MQKFQVGDHVKVRRLSGAPDVLYGEEGPIVRLDDDQYVVRLQDADFPLLAEDLEPAEVTESPKAGWHGGSHV